MELPKTEKEIKIRELHKAVIAGNTEKVLTIIKTKILTRKKYSIDVLDPNGHTPLLIAFIHKKPDVALLLINNGADIQRSTSSGDTPLHYAAWKGYTAVVDALLKRGAHINLSNKQGCGALHLAASEGHLETVKHFIRNGAPIDLANLQNGCTPLHDAVTKNRLSVVQYLISQKAAIDSKNNKGTTPLAIAAKKEHFNCMFELLNNGAQPHLIRKDIYEKLSDPIKKILQTHVAKQ